MRADSSSSSVVAAATTPLARCSYSCQSVTSGQHTGVSAYDRIAQLYDPWSVSVVEDVDFYVEEAVRSGGPVLELGVGTGRIAVPIARAGVRIVGVDSSVGMLSLALEHAMRAGVELELQFGDLRDPRIEEQFALDVIPFRRKPDMET